MYSFDDHPEHKAQLADWGAKSIANALNCTPITDDERTSYRAAVTGLYQAANLTPPTAGRVGFVTSPIVGAMVSTIASGYLWCVKNAKELPEGCGPGSDDLHVILASAREALRRSITKIFVTLDGTPNPTEDRTAKAMKSAAQAFEICSSIERGVTAEAPANEKLVGAFMAATVNWWKLYDGGNFWGGWVYYISFFDHVCKRTDIDYSKFRHYDVLAHAGPRFVHQEFCLISDRPTVVHRDSQNRGHCVDGPHIAWSDGVGIHTLHGIRVTAKITSGNFTAKEALDQPNAEVRRVMIDRYNRGDSGRWARDVGAVEIHADTDWMGRPRRLTRIEVPGDEDYVVVSVTNSSPEPDGTFKVYSHRLHPNAVPHPDRGARHADGKPQKLTCQNAIASTYGYYGHEYKPAVES